MNLMYVNSESGFRPKAIEIGMTTVYLRKDIVEEVRVNPEGERYPVYTYMEAKMSHAEFNAYAEELSRINAVKGVNDSDNIEQLITNGVDTTDNQLILMEAIADLYDVIASMM